MLLARIANDAAALDDLRSRVSASEAESNALRDRHRIDTANLRKRLEEVDHEYQRVSRELAAERARCARLELEVAALRGSRSFRLTAPLRRLRVLTRRQRTP